MPSFYAKIDALVLPSVSHEGLPLTLLEAMSTGIPVIASDAGGSREAFVDGEHGILVRPRDAEGLARAIGKFVSDPALRLEMGRRAREHVHARFSRRRFADDVFAFYREKTAGLR
jgi:glycosyltransferase involved in cell wall biosynthesis